MRFDYDSLDQYSEYSTDSDLMRLLNTLVRNVDLSFVPTVTPYGTKISNLMVVDSYKVKHIANIVLSYTLNGSFIIGEKIINISGAIAGYGIQVDPVTSGFTAVTINGYGINMAGARTFSGQSFMLFVSAYYP